MPLKAVGATALLTAICLGAWEWASSNGHPTIGMVAGIAMVPSGVALAGFLVLSAIGLARIAAERAAARRERSRGSAGETMSSSTAAVEDAGEPRIAA